MSGLGYQDTERRGAERHEIKLSATLRASGGRRVTVEIRNVSVLGFCCEYASTLQIGELMWLKFADLDSMEVVVERRDGYLYGLTFVRPLHVSTLDHLVARYAKTAA
jgi:hypothetical protein